MKDFLARLLEFLFTEDHKAHPLPPQRSQDLQECLRAQPEPPQNKEDSPWTS